MKESSRSLSGDFVKRGLTLKWNLTLHMEEAHLADAFVRNKAKEMIDDIMETNCEQSDAMSDQHVKAHHHRHVKEEEENYEDVTTKETRVSSRHLQSLIY